MPIRVKWLLEGRIVYTLMEGEISADDIVQYDETLVAMMTREGTGLVHNIADLRNITRNASLRDTMRIKAIHHPKTGWALTIGAFDNPIVRMLTSILISLAKARYREVKDLQEALAVLQDRDPSLPDLKNLLDKTP